MACGGPTGNSEGNRDLDKGLEAEYKETYTRFEGKPEELEKFLDEHKPSDPAWNTENTDWICVDNSLEDLDRGESDLEKAVEMWIDLLRSGKVVPKRIIEIALDTKCTSGEWMIFRHRREIDEDWKKIAEATVAGKLGYSANVATAYGSVNSKRSNGIGTHLISVHTKSFADEDDVWRIEKELRSMGIDGTLKYKPDIHTWFDIYVGNEFNIRPSIYISQPKK